MDTQTTAPALRLTPRKPRPAYGAAVVVAAATGVWLSDIFRQVDACTIRYALITAIEQNTLASFASS